jgi:hypothetical protein
VRSKTEVAVSPIASARLGNDRRGTGPHVQKPHALTKASASSGPIIGRGIKACHLTAYFMLVAPFSAQSATLVVTLLSASGRTVGSLGSSSQDLPGDVLTARKGHPHPPKLIQPSLQGQQAMSPPNDLWMERHDEDAILEVSEHVDKIIGPIAKNVIRRTQPRKNGARGAPVIFKVRIIIQGPTHR